MVLHPQGIRGPWKSGVILDWHTVDSVCVGENEFGYPIFDTQRSEIGELLYRFKYQNDRISFKRLILAACNYLDKAKGKFDVVIPIPPSVSHRTVTAQIAQDLAACLEAQYIEDGIYKVKRTDELKNVHDPETRKSILANVFKFDSSKISGKTVFLVDDLYRSGATLGAATEIVYEQGKANAVYVFAITRTRINR